MFEVPRTPGGHPRLVLGVLGALILGGAGSLFGPVLGVSVFLLLEEFLSGLWLYWQLVFGIFLILVVLFANGGIDSWLSGRSKRSHDS